jgi:uncharacterized protein (DUF58 family)
MPEFIKSVGETARNVLSKPYFWILLAVVLGILLLLFIYRKLKLRALSRLGYDRYFSTDGIFAGESLELTEVVYNPTLFPLFFVEMDFFIPSGLTVDGVECSKFTKSTSIFHIPPRATVKKVHEVTSARRDHYKLQNACTIYRKNEFIFDVPIEVYVYPDKYYADVDLSEDIKIAGEAIANKKYIEDPFFFSGIRNYIPGDSMRQVNFKASVRSYSGGYRQLMSNFYESSRNFDSMIYLDLTEYSNSDNFEKFSEALERGLRCACHLFCQAQTYGGRVGFCSNCSTDSEKFINIPCDSSNLHTKKILECFAQISPYARRDHSIHSLLMEAVKLPQSTDIYYITSFVDQKNAELIRTLQRMGRSVTVITLR